MIEWVCRGVVINSVKNMGFFGFGKESPKMGAAQGKSEDAIYRGEVSPIGTDPSQPIEFSLTPEESRRAQEGLLAAKEAAGRADTEKIEVIRDRIFGEQAQPVRSELVGTPRSQAFISDTERFAADMGAKPETQGNGEMHISFAAEPAADDTEPKESDDETTAPSVMGGF